ncbi:MAG: CBS domain-containing protein [Pseudomonadota bacterium]
MKKQSLEIGRLCTERVVTTTADASVLDAAKIMRAEHVGDIVCVSDDSERKPIGILTDRDIVVSMMAPELDPATMQVGDVMSYDLATVPGDGDLLDAIDMMAEAKVRRVPVVDTNGRLAGILSLDDVIGFLTDVLQRIAAVSDAQRWRERVTKL